MTFRIANPYNDNYSNELVVAPAIAAARRYILLCQLGADEIILNRYLVATYKKSLKQLCLALIQDAKIMKNFNKELVVIFTTRQAENLAKLITYGNGVVPGSNILQNALS